MTPWPLKAETERMMAPRLRGSVMPSRATKSGALADVPLLPLVHGFLGEVVGVLVLVRRDLQDQALVHGVVGHPVQLGLAGFQQRDAAFGGELQGFLDPVIHFDADRDVQRLRGDAGTQCLHHGVAAGHHFFGGAALGSGPAGAGAAGTRAALGGGTLGQLLGLVGLVVRAVLGFGRGTLAFESLAAVSTGSDGWALLCLG